MLDSYEIKFFAWCKEGTSDKVWGYVEFKNAPEPAWKGARPDPGSLYNFWGRRGKHLSFKRHYGRWDLHELQRLAQKKLHPSGDKLPYRQIPISEIEKIYPGFTEEFENQLLAAKWSNAVKSDDTENHTFI